MAKNKVGLSFNGWKEMLSGIEKAADESAMKAAIESALKESKSVINSKANAVMTKSNMPAHGKYWTGTVKNSLDKNFSVDWSGYTASINIGYNLEESGLESIMLMKGTPRMNPVAGLEDAFYGRKTIAEIRKQQKEAISKYIERNL